MLKEITPVYQDITNQPMTGTSQIVSAVTDIRYKDSVAVQLQWTGTPTGTFTVDGSLDYVPPLNNVPGAIPQNAGTWTSLTLSPGPAASGSAGQILLNLNQLSFPFIRVTYTNSTGTGVLNGYIFGKSLG